MAPTAGPRFIIAAVSGRVTVVEELIARGADTHRRDRDGRTALMLVSERLAKSHGAGLRSRVLEQIVERSSPPGD